VAVVLKAIFSKTLLQIVRDAKRDIGILDFSHAFSFYRQPYSYLFISASLLAFGRDRCSSLVASGMSTTPFTGSDGRQEVELYQPVFPERVQGRFHLGAQFRVGTGRIMKLGSNLGFILEVDGGLAGIVEKQGVPSLSHAHQLFLHV
jgi:hypothetical protein